MKRIGLSVILAILITFSGVKPASANLIVDFTQVVGKISDYIQKVSDSVQKISQRINQIKLAANQGFDLSHIWEINADFLIPEINLQTKIRQLVEGAYQKKLQVKQDNQDLYKKGAYTNYEEKKNVAASDVAYLKGELAIAQANLDRTKPECNKKYWDYDVENEVWEKDRKWGIYVECKTRQDLYASQVVELTAAVGTMIGVQVDQTVKENRARRKDKNYKERQKHLETLEEAAETNETDKDAGATGEEREFATVDASGKEWDTEGTAKLYAQKNEYYHQFVRRYFYDPEDPKFSGKGWGKEKMVLFQSNTDRLNRERRYLYINTAAHLMQIAGTARREIAKRTKAQDKLSAEAAGTIEGPNEYNALNSFSATRIEHMKALLLYAQVQSAKLQYLAAKELLQAELRKNIIKDEARNKFDKIDLGKYLMETE